MDSVDFQNLFNEKLRERAFSLKKLSELSGIAIKHLENLSSGRFEHLPPAPYMRGYLVRLGRILDFDGNAWWETFREEKFMKTSGSEDQLPKNRFAKEPVGKRAWLAAIAVIVVFYFGFRFSEILGRPELIISSPENNITNVTEEQYVVQGRIEGGNEISVNGESIPIREDGSWEKAVLLQPGLNTLKITGKKFLGRERETIRQIIYEPPFGTTTTSH